MGGDSASQDGSPLGNHSDQRDAPGLEDNQPRQPQQQEVNQPYPQYIVGSQQPSQTQGLVDIPARPYDMAGMAQALPTVDHRQQSYGPAVSRFDASSASHSIPRQAPIPIPQYTTNAPVSQSYYMPPTSQVQIAAVQYYANSMQAAPRGRARMPARPYGVYPGQVASPAAPYFYPPASQFPNQNHGLTNPALVGQFPQPAFAQTHPSVATGRGQAPRTPNPQHSSQRQRQGQSDSRANNVVRGPPRKPKQSGHAIWIGNLPPQTSLMSLVHHVCQKTNGLESLFLISKSNCAFANFKDEQTCLEAQEKINDTRFGAVRLVSRLRKNAVEVPQGMTAPIGPTALAMAPQQQPPPANEESLVYDGDDSSDKAQKPQPSPASTGLVVDGTGSTTSKYSDGLAAALAIENATGSNQGDRFFILKSLTVEDLELSVQNGIWATQSHNEETLNNAFKTSDNVYLIYSANKSGEYFGYARMTSEINEDPAAAIEFAPTAQNVADVKLPKAIPTKANKFTPAGRIIDDSARGTIFWEAQVTEDGASGAADEEEAKFSVSEAVDDVSSAKSEGVLDGAAGGAAGGINEPKAWGKPFRLEWLSTSKLPFYRTRGMRNPLNANREIKIARDGTEVDPTVGQRLIGLFHQGDSSMGQTVSASNVATMPMPMQMPVQMSMPMALPMTMPMPPPY